MASERINIDPGTRRVGYAHRWAKPLLAVLALAASSCAPTDDFWTSPLTMPSEAKVDQVGKSNGMPLVVSVKAGCRADGPVPLEVKIVNVTTQPQGYEWAYYVHPEERFAIWLLFEGQQVPLTKFGEMVQPRRTENALALHDGSMAPMYAGTSKAMQVDLAKLFRIEKPGQYTVVVEDTPVYDDKNPLRAARAAKTWFDILP